MSLFDSLLLDFENLRLQLFYLAIVQDFASYEFMLLCKTGLQPEHVVSQAVHFDAETEQHILII